MLLIQAKNSIMSLILLITFFVIVIVMSAVVHEVAHGWMAHKLGDDTAKDAGRLTFNPIPHLDPVGSIFVPLILASFGFIFGTSVIFGYAKPVPYNPYNLNDPKYGDLKVALAGPGSNFLLAIFFALVARLTAPAPLIKQDLMISFIRGDYDAIFGAMSGSFMTSIFVMLIIACFLNLILMFFNLIPLPPLDGSKVVMTFLSSDNQIKFQQLAPYGMILLLFLIFSGFVSVILYPLQILFILLVGL